MRSLTRQSLLYKVYELETDNFVWIRFYLEFCFENDKEY